jgi:hypothetical protein
LVWKEGYYAEQIETNPCFQAKLNYMHLNAERTGSLKKKEYLYSSHGDYHKDKKRIIGARSIYFLTAL